MGSSRPSTQRAADNVARAQPTPRARTAALRATLGAPAVPRSQGQMSLPATQSLRLPQGWRVPACRPRLQAASGVETPWPEPAWCSAKHSHVAGWPFLSAQHPSPCTHVCHTLGGTQSRDQPVHDGKSHASGFLIGNQPTQSCVSPASRRRFNVDSAVSRLNFHPPGRPAIWFPWWPSPGLPQATLQDASPTLPLGDGLSRNPLFVSSH